MDLYVFKDFELQGLITQYDSLRWTRRFNEIGDCEITMPFDKEIFDLVKIGIVLYHKQTNEACFVKQKNVANDSFGNEKLTIIGNSLLCILKDRIVSFEGTISISDLVRKLLNENFIDSTNKNRNIPNLVIGNIQLHNNPTVNVKYENVDIYTIISEIVQQHNLGFRIDYNILSKKYEFVLYEGEIKPFVKFSKEFNNVLEQEYYLDSTEHKTTCIVENDEGGVTIVNDDVKGLERKETYVKLDSKSAATATEQGNIFLQQYKTIETLDTVMDTNWTIVNKVDTKF